MRFPFVYPCDPAAPIWQTFQDHIDWRLQNNIPESRYKPGVDWGLRYAPIFAAHEGAPARLGHDPKGYGDHIFWLHPSGRVLTVYAHLSKFLVSPQQTGKAGQKIAISGWSGNVWDYQGNRTEAAGHLHFELRIDGVNVDPLPFLRQGYIELDEKGAPVDPDPVRPTLPSVLTLPVFPTSIPMVQFIGTSTLALREMPSADKGSKVIKRMAPGTVMPAFRMERDGDDIWYCVAMGPGYEHWAAAYYGGEAYLEPVEIDSTGSLVSR